MKKRVMVAGVGNMFLKDDGFGAEVAKRMRERDLPEGVEIRDFGTGGLKLAYDLMKGYDALILVDSSPRDEEPGTLYVIEPKPEEFDADLENGGPIDPHGADPATVLRFVKAIGAWPGKILIIGCEPQNVNEFEIGLSEPVMRAVNGAVELVEESIEGIYKPIHEESH
jgi:hydrogenase maturation protease